MSRGLARARRLRSPACGYSLLWAVVFSGIGLLVASLTGKRAFAAGGIVAVFLMTTPVVGVLMRSLPSDDRAAAGRPGQPDRRLVGGVGSLAAHRRRHWASRSALRPGLRHRGASP